MESSSDSLSPNSKAPDLSQALLQKVCQTAIMPSSQTDAPSLATKKVEESSKKELGQLREKINHVMTSYLMTVFELKQTVQEVSMPPSRLKNKTASPKTLEEIQSNLTNLAKDLELLIQWGQGSLIQIQKALEELPSNDTSAPPKSIQEPSHKENTPYKLLKKLFFFRKKK
ncbi:MAG: hypothetical protein HKM07_00110 [Chlamydiae bacterium]|nr:hypothetical protein [Chlamydiota bacterium]